MVVEPAAAAQAGAVVVVEEAADGEEAARPLGVGGAEGHLHHLEEAVVGAGG